MIVWKSAKSLVTGKVSHIPKKINTSLSIVFDDFEWWKSFLTYHSLWVFKNKKSLPEKIQKQLPDHYSMHMWEYDERYHGHRHW